MLLRALSNCALLDILVAEAFVSAIDGCREGAPLYVLNLVDARCAVELEDWRQQSIYVGT